MNNLLITGAPGIGNTTLIKKIIPMLKSKNIELDGFYTEEIRNDNNERVGFEVVTLDGKRAILATKRGRTEDNEISCKPMVGQYIVHINEFEELVLPILQKPKKTSLKILIIDEIGKMELLSKKFKEAVSNIFFDKTANVIATVPYKGGAFFVRQLKERKDCHVIIMDESNRHSSIYDVNEWYENNKRLNLFL